MDGVVGYGFRPTNAELIGCLRKKRLDPEVTSKNIGEVDLYKHEPSELPGLALVRPDAPVLYFYVALDYKRGNRKRACVNRRTRGGTWKVTGKERDIKDDPTNKVIGTKRTLVFYNGRTTSKDARTNWVMHEFQCKSDPLFKGDFVVVRIKRKPNYKSDASTPIESGASHHLTSDSGDHSAVVSQVEVESLPLQNDLMSCNSEDHTANFMFSKEFQPPSNHGIYVNREFQLQQNDDISINKESQLLNYNDYSIFNNGESQLLSDNGISSNRESPLLSDHYGDELQHILQSSLDISIDGESCVPNHNEQNGLSLPSDYSDLITGVFICDELPPNCSVSINRESKQYVSINGVSQLVNYDEVENYGSASSWSTHDEFYGEETGMSLPFDFYYSNLIIEDFIYDELPPDCGVSINRESQQYISINGESQLSNFGEVEDYGSTSSSYANDEFYDEGTDMSIPSNFYYSNSVTGAFVCDELPPNYGVSINRESQQYISINGEYQLLNYGEVEDYGSTSLWSAHDESYDKEIGMSLPSNFYYPNPATRAFVGDELPPNSGVSINRESQQYVSINGESHLIPNYGEVQDNGSTSA